MDNVQPDRILWAFLFLVCVSIAVVLLLVLVFGVPPVAAVEVVSLISIVLMLFLILRRPIVPQTPDRIAPALFCTNCGKYSVPEAESCSTCGQAFG
jgi:hypothetical protein